MERDYLFDEVLDYLNEHSEENYCIYEIMFEEAIELGKTFEQYAIFFAHLLMSAIMSVRPLKRSLKDR